MWYNYFEKGFEPHIGMWSGTVESQWKWSNLRAGKKKKTSSLDHWKVARFHSRNVCVMYLEMNLLGSHMH